MSKFDSNEQKIYDTISQISVDSSKLVRQVKSRLHLEVPNVNSPHWSCWTKSAVAAIAMSVVLVVTAAAVLGGFDWFIEKFNPPFSEIVEPVEVYSEDQGIRMEVIGARKYDNMAIVYLSLQDISGQNRLTEHTEFKYGFNVKVNPNVIETTGQTEETTYSIFSYNQEMLYFDEDTNTVYYEFNITADPNSPLADPLEISSFLIYFDKKAYKDELIPVSLAEIDKAETAPITQEHIWGGTNIGDNRSLFTEALTPGYYTDMPHGEEDQWVSNIGIVDGKLHVQIGKIFNEEFGSSDVTLSLIDSEGELIDCEYELMLLADENNNLLNLEDNDYAEVIYKYEESVFSVSAEELSKYTLCFTGWVSSGVEGNWKVAANLSDSNQNTLIWDNDISVEGHLFKHISLNPLGMQAIGTYEGEECLVSEMSIAIETFDDIILLEYGGGSQNPEKQSFSSSWKTKNPVDVSKVAVIIINDVRIPVTVK
jgi:hypothetical protein